MLGSEGNIDMLSKNMAEQTMVKLNSSSKDDEIKKSKEETYSIIINKQ